MLIHLPLLRRLTPGWLRPSFALTPSIKKKFGRRLRTSVSRLRLSFALKRDDEASRVFGWVLEM